MLPSTDERVRRHKRMRQPMFFLGVTMTLAYIALGAYLLWDKSSFRGIQPELLNIFAGLLIAYGVYRGWRIYTDFVQ